MESQNLLSEGRECQLYSKTSSGILAVEDSVDLDNVHGDQAACVSDHFHGEMRLTITETATHRCTDSWGLAWVQRIHVEAQMQGIALWTHNRYSLAHHL